MNIIVLVPTPEGMHTLYQGPPPANLETADVNEAPLWVEDWFRFAPSTRDFQAKFEDGTWILVEVEVGNCTAYVKQSGRWSALA